MHLDGFNLNLLVALDALLAASTMTEAADRLSLTQPALSGALKQLREHYRDPLIFYSPAGSQLTPLAQQLVPLVRDLLTAARGTAKIVPTFEPATSSAQLLIVASDWIELTVVKNLLRVVAREAPCVCVTVRSARPGPAEDFFRKGADLVFTADPYVSPTHSSELVFQEHFACIAWEGNPRVASGLNRDTFIASPHLGLTGGVTDASPAFRAMEAERTVTICASMHAALPHIVVGTELLAITIGRFAEEAARTWPIRILELPYEIPPLEISLQWQPWRDRDPMLLWIRQQLRACLVGASRTDQA